MHEADGIRRMAAFFENRRMEEAAAYANRGREYAGLTIDDLNRGWVKEFRNWARASALDERFDLTTLNNLESELLLRGKDPPVEQVRAEMETVAARSRRDPQRLQSAEERLTRELEVFHQQLDDKKN